MNFDLYSYNVCIYCPEKTLADCFKFRNKIGMDIAMEAVRLHREQRKVKVNDLMRYAAICRVAKVMRPYIEAFLVSLMVSSDCPDRARMEGQPITSVRTMC